MFGRLASPAITFVGQFCRLGRAGLFCCLATKELVMPILSVKEYLDKDGLVCPVCQSTDLEGGSIDDDSECYTQDITCLDCKAMWTDIYGLAHYEFTSHDAVGRPQAVLGNDDRLAYEGTLEQFAEVFDSIIAEYPTQPRVKVLIRVEGD